MKNKKDSYGARMPLAITLIVAAFASAFFISTYSNKGYDYWVIAQPVTPGHVIALTDLRTDHLNLGDSADYYLTESDQIVGLVATRQMQVGEVMSTADVSSSAKAMATSAVPLNLRSGDLAFGVNVGDSVDLYWVLDSRNGEEVIDPILILGGVTLIGLDSSKNSLGGDVSITVAIEETQVLRMLSATTLGRLVVVRSHV
jgi:Chaperone for flagella basal body P-ring formation